MVRLKMVREVKMYKDVFNFSAWVSVGAVAHIIKNQGAALVVNTFFNTIMNTAMGVASSISTYVSLFANAAIQPMQPQITKSYASGDIKRTDELLVMSTKYTFLLTLLVGSILIVSPNWLLSLWLGEVPPFASTFLVLLVIDNLVQSLNAGINNIIWASGKISFYQVLTSTLNFLAIIGGFFVLRAGFDAYYLIVTYIIFSILRFFAIQWALHHTLSYDNMILWKKSYIPSLTVVALFSFVFFIPDIIHPGIRLVISFIYLVLLEFFIGLNKSERIKIQDFASKRLRK